MPGPESAARVDSAPRLSQEWQTGSLFPAALAGLQATSRALSVPPDGRQSPVVVRRLLLARACVGGPPVTGLFLRCRPGCNVNQVAGRSQDSSNVCRYGSEARNGHV